MAEPSPGAEVARRTPYASTLSVMSDGEINRSWRLAEALAASGTFPDVREAAKAFAIMLVGHDLGLSPTQALMGVHMVKGKPQIAATTLGGFVRARGYDYRVMEHDETHCMIEFGPRPAPRMSVKHWPDKYGVSTFTIDDAVTAALAVKRADGSYTSAEKASEGWGKYPKNMLFARAMSNGVKWYVPDALGGIPVYTEGDEFEVRAALTEGAGSGEAQGIELGPKVEKVLARAETLGHAGLASRATAEMTLAHRSPEKLGEWAAKAEAELDQFEAGQPPDAEVVEPTPDQLKATAAQLRDDAVNADAEGNHDEAQLLRAHADEMEAHDGSE